MKIFYLLFTSLLISNANGNTKNDPHLPISHCYHWLNESSNQYLSFKYDYAGKNKNELTFFTTPETSNGSVAGQGLYCAKSPSGSFTYGDRVIRVDLVDDIVLYDDQTGITHCGLNGVNSQNSKECASKTWDIKFYSGGGIGNSAWYVIQNPEAIKSWSSNSNQLIADLEASVLLNNASFSSHAQKTIQYIRNERDHLGERTFYTETTRSSIVEMILNDPDKLRKIPALNIILRLSNDQSSRITELERKEIYLKYLEKTLSDSEITFSTYKSLIEKSDIFKKAFQNIIQRKIHNNTLNPLLYLEAVLDKNLEINSSSELLKKLVTSIFSDRELLNSFSTSESVSNELIINFIKAQLSKEYSTDQVTRYGDVIISISQKIQSDSQTKALRGKLINTLNTSVADSSIYIFAGDKKFNLFEPSNTANKKLCHTIVSLSEDNSDLKLKAYQLDITLERKNSTNSSQICNQVTNILDTLTNLSQDEIKDLKYIVKGRFENISFLFLGEHRDHIISQCQKFYARSINGRKIDDIYWSINDNNEQHYYQDKGYLETKDQLCNTLREKISSHISTKAEIEAEIKFNKLITNWRSNSLNLGLSYKVTGRFESFKFFFFGDSSDEIESQCRDYYNYIENKSRIDDLYWSINGGREQHYYQNDGYLKTKDLLCTKLVEEISATIPSKAELEARRKYNELISKWKNSTHYSKSVYKVTGRFEEFKFFFFGESSDEIESQCREYYTHVPNRTKVDHIYWKINDGNEESYYQDRGYLKTKDLLCTKLAEVISATVPSKAELEAKRKYDKLIAKWQGSSEPGYKVTGRFENFKFYFFGVSSDQIESQCREYYTHIPNKTKVDHIYWKVNNGKEKTFYQSSGYLKTRDLLCNKLLELANVPKLDTLKRIDMYKERVKKWKSSFNSSSDIFKITGEFYQSLSFYFHGNNRDEIYGQCRDFFDENRLFDLREVFNFTLNGKTINYISGDTVNISSFCDIFMLALAQANILSIQEIKEQARRVSMFKDRIKTLKNSFEGSDSRYKIKGRFGEYDFYLAANDYEEFQESCNIYKNGTPENVDKIFPFHFTYKGKRYETSLSRREICDTLLSKIGRQNIKTRREIAKTQFFKDVRIEFDNAQTLHNFEVLINEEKLFLNVNSLNEISSQCINRSIYMENIANINEIRFQNNGKEVIQDIELEQQNRVELCDKLKYLFVDYIPFSLSETMRTSQELSQAKFKVTGRFGQVSFYFYGNDADDIADQCNDYFDELKDLNEEYEFEIDRFSWDVNVGEKTYYISNSRTLRSRRSTCKLFAKTLKKQLR